MSVTVSTIETLTTNFVVGFDIVRRGGLAFKMQCQSSLRGTFCHDKLFFRYTNVERGDQFFKKIDRPIILLCKMV